MELNVSPLSPYVRKVLVVAHEIGVAERIRLVPTDTRAEVDKIASLNPLGKIPVLVTDSGQTIYDSPVICEYLDARFGGYRLLPASGDRRWAIMTGVALADGMIDAAILVRHERARPEARQSPDWIAWQMRKVQTGLDHLESVAPSFGDALDMAQIAAGCALGYMPLRLTELVGLPRWPHLREWFARMSERASFRATVPVL